MNRTMRVHDILLTEANATMMLMLLARNKCHSQLQRLTLRDLHGVCRMCTDTILHSSHKHTHTHTLESIYLYVCMLSSAAESKTLWLSLFLVAMVITMSSPSLDFGFVDAFGANKRVLSSKADDFICI